MPDNIIEAAELKKHIEQVRRGALQLVKSCEKLAKYLDVCYSKKEYLNIDETAILSTLPESD